MMVNGCDCSIVIKTDYKEMDIPYAEETLREAVSFLQEEASIEGDGVCRGIRKVIGVTGCIVTPLTIDTAPLLLYLAMGSAGLPVYVSETKNLYRVSLNLLPIEDTDSFDLIQDRSINNRTAGSEQLAVSGERKLYERCRVKGFEMRIMRDEAIKLKLDISSEWPPTAYPYLDTFTRERGEQFSGDNATYEINGQEYKNIYGITLISKKDGGTKTEIWVKRALETGSDIPLVIDEMVITAHLLRTLYEYRHFGMFRLTLKKLVLISDETSINSCDTVIGPLRYYITGNVETEVFTTGDEV